MHLEMKLLGWVIGATWTLALTSLAYGNEVSVKSVRDYITANLIAVDPSMMVLVGVGLIALRVLMARRSRRRENDPAHS